MHGLTLKESICFVKIIEFLLVLITEHFKAFMKGCLSTIDIVRNTESLSLDILIIEKVRIEIDAEMLLNSLLLNQLNIRKTVLYDLVGLFF